MYLGIDIGTSGVKTVLVDGEQRVSPATASRSRSNARIPAIPSRIRTAGSPRPSRRSTPSPATHPTRVRRCEGIGLSGQMHGATLLGADHKPLRPCILWNDGRSARGMPRARGALAGSCGPSPATRRCPASPRRSSSGLPSTSRTSSLRTALGPAAEGLCPPGTDGRGDRGHVGRRRHAVAGCRRGATGRMRGWRRPGCRAMPCRGSSRARRRAASCAPDLAARWGMAKPPVVAGSAGDNAAGAVGLGAIRPGSAFVSLGTSGVLWATTDRFAPNPGPRRARLLPCRARHLAPDGRHPLGRLLPVLGLGDLRRQGGRAARPARRQAPGALAGAASCPTFRASARRMTMRGSAALFAGLGHETGRDAMVQAVLEGVAFAFADCRDALAAAGTRIEAADVIGGGSRSRSGSRSWPMCSASRCTALAEGETGGAFGAARLGRLAATGEEPGAVCLPPERVADDRAGSPACAAPMPRRWRPGARSIRRWPRWSGASAEGPRRRTNRRGSRPPRARS